MAPLVAPVSQYGYPLLIYQLIIGDYCPIDAYNSHLLEILYGAGTVGPVSGASVHLCFQYTKVIPSTITFEVV